MRIFKQLLLVFLVLMLSGPAAGQVIPGNAAGFEENRALLPMVMTKYPEGPGSITGRAFDASKPTHDSIEGAEICVFDQCDTTDSDGIYMLEGIPGGMRWLEAAAPDFYQTYEIVRVKEGEVAERDIALTPFLELSDVFMRVVVTWNETPVWPPDNTRNDLDAHLWLEAPDPPTHIDFSYRGDCTTFPNACLESDYQTGYGPETLAIRQLESTTYHFGVLNYYAGYPGVPPITSSQAKVRVYLESGEYYEFDVPTTGTGDFWYVFSLESDGTTASLEEHNCITGFNGEVPDCSKASTQSIPISLRKIK